MYRGSLSGILRSITPVTSICLPVLVCDNHGHQQMGHWAIGALAPWIFKCVIFDYWVPFFWVIIGGWLHPTAPHQKTTNCPLEKIFQTPLVTSLGDSPKSTNLKVTSGGFDSTLQAMWAVSILATPYTFTPWGWQTGGTENKTNKNWSFYKTRHVYKVTLYTFWSYVPPKWGPYTLWKYEWKFISLKLIQTFINEKIMKWNACCLDR